MSSLRRLKVKMEKLLFDAADVIAARGPRLSPSIPAWWRRCVCRRPAEARNVRDPRLCPDGPTWPSAEKGGRIPFSACGGYVVVCHSVNSEVSPVQIFMYGVCEFKS